jgi:hypothetical protein
MCASLICGSQILSMLVVVWCICTVQKAKVCTTATAGVGCLCMFFLLAAGVGCLCLFSARAASLIILQLCAMYVHCVMMACKAASSPRGRHVAMQAASCFAGHHNTSLLDVYCQRSRFWQLMHTQLCLQSELETFTQVETSHLVTYVSANTTASTAVMFNITRMRSPNHCHR